MKVLVVLGDKGQVIEAESTEKELLKLGWKGEIKIVEGATHEIARSHVQEAAGLAGEMWGSRAELEIDVTSTITVSRVSAQVFEDHSKFALKICKPLAEDMLRKSGQYGQQDEELPTHPGNAGQSGCPMIRRCVERGGGYLFGIIHAMYTAYSSLKNTYPSPTELKNIQADTCITYTKCLTWKAKS